MKEKTEQQRLAELVQNQNSEEPIDTGSILAENLKAIVGSPDASIMQQVISEENDLDLPSKKPKEIISNSKEFNKSDREQISTKENFPREKIMMQLYDVRDNLIESFSTCDFNSSTSRNIASNILKIGNCIHELGGDVEIFDPFNYISGLSKPSENDTAKEVIKRTIECYNRGKIIEAKIQPESKEIHIVFSGLEGNTEYTAVGRVKAKNWMGNEAIDYVYTPNSGRMSVKAFINDGWINQSENENYEISWELNEVNLSKTSSKKEEVSPKYQNLDIDSDMEEEKDIGDPIEQE